MRGRQIITMIVVAMIAIGVTRASIADEVRVFKVIVHPSNTSTTVSRDFLRDAYLKKATEWHGVTLRPIDLSSKFSARDQFTTTVIRKSPAQLRTYWNQQVFSGKGVPPPEVDSVADVIAYVLANPGAVGYVPVDADPGKAKVIGIQ